MHHTFAIIKPDAVQRGLVGKVIKRLEQRGFVITKMELRQLHRTEVEDLYAKFEGEDFFDDLCRFMCGGDGAIPMILYRMEKPVPVLRKLAGDTAQPAPGTIRGDLSDTFRRNIIHAADSTEAASYEAEIFFPDNGIM